MIGYICAGVVLLIILIVVMVCFYNKMIKLRNLVNEAYATMDVYLKKRADIIPNMVAAARGYAKHEKEIFANADKAISAWSGEERNRSTRFLRENELDTTVSSMKALCERYPQINASENFLALQNELHDVEKDIANARKYYNGVVNSYNSTMQTFPANIAAFLLGFRKEQLFVASVLERESVSISF